MEIIYDVKKHTFSSEGFEESHFRDQNIYVGFVSDGSLPVEFSDFNFSIKVSLDDEVLLSESYPPEGYEVIFTDQPFLNAYHVCNLKPDQEYFVDLYVSNDGEEHEFRQSFCIGAVKALYPSWVWSDSENDWVPPVPEPSDGEYYWEESLQQWTPVEEMLKRTFGN